MFMQRISYQNLFRKLFVGVALAATAYIVCFTPAITHAQTSAFAGGWDCDT